MNECGLDPGIDHMLAMEAFHRIKEEGGKVRFSIGDPTGDTFHFVCLPIHCLTLALYRTLPLYTDTEC